MRVTLVHALIVIFIAALLTFISKEAYSEPFIGLGYTAFNSELPTGEAGYRYGKWDYTANAFAAGDTKKGLQEQVFAYSVSRIVQPGDHWFMRIGLAYVTETPLVGHGNYRLGFGYDFGAWEVEYMHLSSAGINETNRGVDAVMLRVML